MATQKQTSPWVYVGIGCLVVIVAAVAVTGSCVYMGYRAASSIKEMTLDPERREAAVLEQLDVATLPSGYYPAAAFSFPYLIDASILTDRPPDEEERVDGFDQYAFLFAEVRPFGSVVEQVREVVEGTRDNLDFVETDAFDVRRDQLLTRGEFDYQQGTVDFSAHRARVRNEGETEETIIAVFHLQCPDSSKVRFGAWLAPAPPEPEGVDAEADPELYRGTPADADALKAFLENFRLCPSG